MIVAFLNQKGGAGKTTLALNLAGEWARRGLRITLGTPQENDRAFGALLEILGRTEG